LEEENKRDCEMEYWSSYYDWNMLVFVY
jgi:hypothetical protein